MTTGKHLMLLSLLLFLALQVYIIVGIMTGIVTLDGHVRYTTILLLSTVSWIVALTAGAVRGAEIHERIIEPKEELEDA